MENKDQALIEAKIKEAIKKAVIKIHFEVEQTGEISISTAHSAVGLAVCEAIDAITQSIASEEPQQQQ